MEIKKETVYIVKFNGTSCLLYSLDDAMETFKECLGELNFIKEATLTVCEMSQEEINKLPEFDGF